MDEKIDITTGNSKKIGRYKLILLAVSLLWDGYMYYFVIAALASGNVTIGSFSMYLGVLGNLVSRISSLLGSLNRFGYWSKTVDMVREYRNMENHMESGSLSVEGIEKVEIEFENVSFRYLGSQEFALKNVSLKIKPGERLAVVGRNGAGKSTFVKLLCRLYELSEGAIYLGNVNIKEIKEISYEDCINRIGCVFQDFRLIAATVQENTSCSTSADSTRLSYVYSESGLEEILADLPNGENTDVYRIFSDSGVELSGGQAQKLAIARLLYRSPQISVLDEPTSALDPAVEYEVYSKFSVNCKTSIFVFHRLSGADQYDKIAVFDDGKITEYGSFVELMKKNSTFAEMYRIQSGYYNSGE